MSNLIFNPAKFLYYNPEFAAYSNIITNQQAVNWAASNDMTQFIYNDSSIPNDFDAEVFISDFKNNLNASILNETIRVAMSNEGFTPSMLNQRARYTHTIYKRARVEALDTLKFNFQAARPEDQYTIRPAALRVGDLVKLQNDTTKIFDYATVTTIIDSETFSVLNARRAFDNIGDIYTVIGIRLFDFVRLARINFLRGLSPPPQVPNPDAITFIDSEFIPDLYRLLYEDAQQKSDREAYFDYINRRDNGERRIGRVDDFALNSNLFEPVVDNLNINYRLTLESNAGFEWGNYYVYGISQDDTTKSQSLNVNYDRLMTEWAIKKYIDRSYLELAVFNNVIVNGSAIFNGPVEFNSSLSVMDMNVRRDLTVQRYTTLQSNLDVHGFSTFDGGIRIIGSNSHYIENVEIHNVIHTGSNEFVSDAYFRSNVLVDGYSMGPRFSIGPAVSVQYDESPMGLYNARLKNTEIFETLQVGTHLPTSSVAVNVNGYLIADNVNYISDMRVKRINSRLENSLSAQDIIKAVEPVTFAYNNALQKERIGFIADEIEEVLPNAVKCIKEHELDNMFVKLHVESLSVLGMTNNTILHLNPGDEMHIKETGEWIVVATFVGKGDTFIDLESSLDASMLNMTITIDKIKYKNVKTIDYTSLVATLWAAMRNVLS